MIFDSFVLILCYVHVDQEISRSNHYVLWICEHHFYRDLIEKKYGKFIQGDHCTFFIDPRNLARK